MSVAQHDERMIVLGETIRELRVEAGESQGAAAAACGIRSRPYWTLLELGQVNISVERLLRIADHYKVTIATLCADLGTH